MKNTRIEKIQAAMQAYGLDALALIAGPDLTYLCGLQFHLSERPVILLIKRNHMPILIHPELELEKVKTSSIFLESHPYTEDRSSWIQTISNSLRSLNLNGKNIGVNPVSIRFLEMNLLEQAIQGCHFVPADRVIMDIRVQKDELELLAMRKAVAIAERALLATIPQIAPEKTEKEIANLLMVNLLLAGSDTDLPFMPIVASGKNSANPHAIPTDKPLRTGDLLIIDWGARADGYISDITRTFAIGNISNDFQQIAQTVKQANQESQKNVRPGVSSHEIDCAARDVISQAGYGQYFIHRTGHGIGLETHEEPYIQQGNSLVIKQGMTFTIEPGIYLPDKGGVRIEDNVFVTENGVEILTSLPREIQIISKEKKQL